MTITSTAAQPSAPFRKSGALSDDRLVVRGKDAGNPDSGSIGTPEDAATGGETPSGMCRDLRNGVLGHVERLGRRPRAEQVADSVRERGRREALARRRELVERPP